MELFSLKGKIALVTGATGYLGQIITEGLAAAGAIVYVNARTEEKVNILVRKIRAAGNTAEPAVFDVTKEADIKRFFSLNPKVDIIVSNAYAGGSGSTDYTDSEDYEKAFKIVIQSPQLLVKYGLNALRCAVTMSDYASFITISSMYGVNSPDLRIYENKKEANPPYYGAAKAALIQWTKYLACEFGHERIRFNTISPGPFPNIGSKTIDPQFIDKLINKVPLNRIGNPSELVGPVVFLASKASSFVTGSNIIVDGGWTSW